MDLFYHKSQKVNTKKNIGSGILFTKKLSPTSKTPWTSLKKSGIKQRKMDFSRNREKKENNSSIEEDEKF
jgi:hypothetical protein